MADDDDLDALLDDAFDAVEAAQEDELHRQEGKKQKAAEQVAADGTQQDDELTGLLEKALSSLKETGTEEDKTLQDLVEQGLSLMKGSDDENNEQEVFQKCLGLLDSVTKEIHSESGGAEDPMGAMNPLMQQLSKAMGDVAQGLKDGIEEGGEGANALGSEEEHAQLMEVMKGLGAAAAAHPEGEEGAAGEAGEAGEIPSELLQALSGGEAPDMMKALGDVLSGLSPDDMPKTAEDLEQVAKLKKDIRETLGDVPSEMQGSMAQMIDVLDKLTGAESAEKTTAHTDPAAGVETQPAQSTDAAAAAAETQHLGE